MHGLASTGGYFFVRRVACRGAAAEATLTLPSAAVEAVPGGSMDGSMGDS